MYFEAHFQEAGMTIFDEKERVGSMRRTLAFLAFLNGIGLSWRETAWQVIALWIAAALILLGLTTISDLKELAKAGKE